MRERTEAIGQAASAGRTTVVDGSVRTEDAGRVGGEEWQQRVQSVREGEGEGEKE